MARPLRIEYPGAVYHITSRGDRREDIYLSSHDMNTFLATLGSTCERYAWHCYAYCLMNNHYHLLIETPLANLSKGMRHLNGVYTQRFNKEHNHVGHVFQGRYKSILVEKENYLLELCRYIVLNPLRAKIVNCLNDWQWSSYLAMTEDSTPPKWLKVDSILPLFGLDRKKAQKAYIEFVHSGINKNSPWDNLKNQIYLGSQEFVNLAIRSIDQDKQLSEIPKIQYAPEREVRSLIKYKEQFVNRDQVILQAYASGDYTLKEIADFFELHYSRVSKIVNTPN
ncbi:MAG: transposase [Tatlockia sp.]|nr:transposase [Tatlockia sp.]